MAREVVLKDVVVKEPEEKALRLETSRMFRLRRPGFWIAAILALLCFIAMSFSFRMMHYQQDVTTVDATIVAVGRDPQNGEVLMTSEFFDAEGKMHRDTQTAGYHYAIGEPEVGQHLKYIYWRNKLSGELEYTPRADGILKWIFGSAGTILSLFALGSALFLSWHHRQRLDLLAKGRREAGARYAIESRTIIIPSKVAHVIPQWRLSARYFENSLSEFKDCYSDWQPGLAPTQLADVTVPMILVDPLDPRRYWLPVGELHDRASLAAH